MTLPPDRIVAVTTLKDSVENARWFAHRTLASGVDHLVIFLDQGQPNVRQALEELRHVTVIPTVRGYWNAERPVSLAERQQVNAALANAVFAVCPSVRWLFCVDGDEILDFDRTRILEGDLPSLRFPTFEVAAQRDAPSREGLPFKKMPSDLELQALAGLGAIREADLGHYLRGNSTGRVGVRPDLAIRPGPHGVEDCLAPVAADGIVLHYQSWSLDDLVGRWQDVTARKAAEGNYSERWKRVGLAVNAIVNHSKLDERTRREYLVRIFDEHVADDQRTLDAMGLLLRPTVRTAEPRTLPPEDLVTAESLFDALRTVDKAPFRAEAGPSAIVDVLDRVGPSLASERAADRVRQAVATHRQGMHEGAAGQHGRPT